MRRADELNRLLARGFLILALAALAWYARDDLNAWYRSGAQVPSHCPPAATGAR